MYSRFKKNPLKTDLVKGESMWSSGRSGFKSPVKTGDLGPIILSQAYLTGLIKDKTGENKVIWKCLINAQEYACLFFFLLQWVVFSPETFPYEYLGSVGTYTKYLADNHKIYVDIG